MNRKIFAISVVVLAIDQISKSVIGTMLQLNESFTVINNFFNITLVHNYGAAWSIFNNRVSLLVIGTTIALAVIYRYMYSFKMNKRNTIVFGILTGGILGNLVDRVFLGYVIDFFDFNILGYSFPVFNIADIAIVIGVALLVYAIIKGEDKNEKNNSPRKIGKN